MRFPPTRGAEVLMFLVAFCWLLALASPFGAAFWAFLTSGFWFLLAKMSLREAPTTALWNFWVLLVLFLATSSSIPFLCLRLYRTVQVIFLGFLFKSWDF